MKPMSQQWSFNRTILRVMDVQKSIEYYQFLGLEVLDAFKDNKTGDECFLLAYPNGSSFTSDWKSQKGVLELRTRQAEAVGRATYDSGNVESKKGFGHICISVDNIQAACQRLEDASYPFQKRLSEGRMNFIAFALDPDGYWVEIVGQKSNDQAAHLHTTDPSMYKLNHSMIRIKDPARSLPFYQDVMGMELLKTKEVPAAGFNLYFLHYARFPGPAPENVPEGVAESVFRDGLLELTWNYGTEKEDGKIYHSGNEEPVVGFMGFGLGVPDIKEAKRYLKEKDVEHYEDEKDAGENKDLTVLDPDGYHLIITQTREV